MQTSINLQEPFKYSIIPLIITMVLLAIIIFLLTYTLRRKQRIRVESIEVKEIPEKNIKNIRIIKGKFLNELDSIEYKYKNGKIQLRKAYQLISENIRLFVFDVTDITTQNYSLSEIKKLDIPILYELIKEYYEPEFAKKSVGDFDNSINKARRVIKEWK